MANRGKLHGKVALITGGGSGIGTAAAELFAREQAVVIVADVRLDAAERTAQGIREHGGAAAAVALDVTQEPAWQTIVAEVIETHGKLDVLVNNAGISISQPIQEMSLEQWRSVMAVNLDGVFLGTKYAMGAMSRNGGGSIVNISSVSGITPSPGASNYCASKAAVRMFSKTAAIECADAGNGIRVNVVTPGGVKTPMWENEPFFQSMVETCGGVDEAFAELAGQEPSHQFFSADEVARTILYLASDESSHITGAEVVLDRGHAG